ncbi:virulence factor TspB C-terminal domain-related protein [Xanthomonas arboricola]|uniref:virulence factor TspB C-terminal domain-related protein n=1 Tax=Xanthomonas arboricola TaxID=56448 RepID=UPI0013E08A85|nr:virulence factor TspB C-terminal domain-related protein [Xanthomonas arboricola]
MGWNARAAHLVRRLSVALCVALIMCVVGAVYAAGATVTARSTGYYRMGTNANGSTRWGTRTEFAAMWENALGGSVSRSVTAVGEVSSTTLGSLGRKALRGGVYGAAVGLAVDGIIKGAGWAIGELKDQVTSPGSQDTIPQGTEAWCYTGGKDLLCSTSAESLCSAHYGGQIVTQNSSAANCRVPGVDVYTLIRVPLQQPTPDYASGSPPRTITDTELGDRLRDQPDIVNDLLTDPRTGSPIMTPELQQQADKIKQDIDQREGIGDGSPNPVVMPPLDDDTAQPTETDWPSFCGWATVVCDFIDWVKKDDSPEKQPLPERDLDIDPNSWSSGVGEGACPSPQQFSITVTGYAASGEYSFQPLCDFASQLKPLLIVVASIVAVMILAGLRSTNAK